MLKDHHELLPPWETTPEYLDKKERITRTIAAPAFRKFCQANGMYIADWRDVHKELFDPNVDHGRITHIWTARVMFNEEKDKYVFFESSVISYYLNEYFEPVWEQHDVNDILKQQELKILEQEIIIEKYRNRVPVLYALSVVWLSGLAAAYDFLSEILGDWIVLIIMLPVPLSSFLTDLIYESKQKKIASKRRTLNEKGFNEILAAINKLSARKRRPG